MRGFFILPISGLLLRPILKIHDAPLHGARITCFPLPIFYSPFYQQFTPTGFSHCLLSNLHSPLSSLHSPLPALHSPHPINRIPHMHRLKPGRLLVHKIELRPAILRKSRIGRPPLIQLLLQGRGFC